MFTGMTVTNYGQRLVFHLFDGSTNNPQTKHWDETMPSCTNLGGNWRTYASVVWKADYDYDQGTFYGIIKTYHHTNHWFLWLIKTIGYSDIGDNVILLTL